MSIDEVRREEVSIFGKPAGEYPDKWTVGDPEAY